ncbi:MAG TPA: MFS transporter [Candidatus Fimivicinus intestinavium]|nr:MFS transporter [Candidatus Fimivicinus intestinavium]
MRHNRAGFDAHEKRLFQLCWAAYFATYICRLNFSAVMPELSALELFSKSQIASVSSCFFITYGAGQFINGFLGDRIAPRQMVFGGLMISAMCNIALFFLHSYAAMIFLWGLNGFVQSMVWSPLLRIAGEYYDEKGKAKFGIDISTTVPLGTLASYGVSLLALKLMPWNGVFFVCGSIVLVVGFAWLFGTGRLLPKMEKVTPPAALQAQAGPGKLPLKPFLKMFASSGLILLLIPIAVHGTLKDGVTQWVPTYIVEIFAADSSVSLALTMLLPVVNVAGAYVAKWLNRYIRSEPATAGVFFAAALGLLAVLLFWGDRSMLLTILCLAGITTSMFGVNVMMITFIPLHFSRYGRTSSMSGFLNSVAYIGCGVSNFGTGYLLNHFSWDATILLWMGLAGAAIVLSVAAVRIWKNFQKRVTGLIEVR